MSSSLPMWSELNSNSQQRLQPLSCKRACLRRLLYAVRHELSLVFQASATVMKHNKTFFIKFCWNLICLLLLWMWTLHLIMSSAVSEHHKDLVQIAALARSCFDAQLHLENFQPCQTHLQFLPHSLFILSPGLFLFTDFTSKKGDEAERTHVIFVYDVLLYIVYDILFIFCLW